MPDAPPRLRDSFRGALVGTLVGEALGLPFDGWSPGRIRREIGDVREMREGRSGVGRVGEAGTGAIALAEALLADVKQEGEPPRTDRLEAAELARRLADTYDPARGYGRGMLDVLRRLKAGESAESAAFHTYPRGSFGNGAAARIAPVAVLMHDQKIDLVRMAEDSALVTHAHPLGIAGAVLQARQITMAIANRGTVFDPVSAVVSLLSDTDSSEFRQRLRAVESCLDKTSDLDVVHDRLGCNATALGSVPAAIYCFLARLESFDDAVALAVSMGGASAPIAAMTGAIAGAFHGARAIPRRWRDLLETGAYGADAAERLADRLLERSLARRARYRS